MESMLTTDWSELPSDVLEHLTSFLPLSDYCRFGAVCQNWNSVAKQNKYHSPRQLPWLVLGEDDATHKRKFFSIEENKHYLIDIPELCGQRLCGSSYGWVFTVDIELNFRLLNPCTKKCYDLPPLPPFSEQDNINTYQNGSQSEECSFADMQLRLVYRGIVDRDPSCSSDFRVLIIYGMQRRLAYWRRGDSSWTLIEGLYNSNIQDVIFFKEKFYAVGLLSTYHQIYIVNVGPDPKIEHIEPMVPNIHDSLSYLVDYMGQLLLVQRRQKLLKNWSLMTKKISIEKIDLEDKKFSDYELVDGHSVFMGASTSVIVDPSKHPRCKKNSLYLTDVPQFLSEENGCQDLWIYDMSERSFSRYYDPEVYIPFIAFPVWLLPNLQ